MGFENLKRKRERERETRSCLFSESEKVQKRQTGRNVPKVGQVEITGIATTQKGKNKLNISKKESWSQLRGRVKYRSFLA